ncbi:ABC transporter type 1, transmembrane domain-containing protein [Kockovaella imperatae]|uniref:ABC transporter type 1, transmembrane domain-containing protein n=1 Tax=Kockovaella imperatae TaxID=4999 RepID=A0A1Y1UKZ5_9TREE|nr:ABC transporter type 1, transmembrane domain-containing protein [Kockovaella imperatae]ORX38217.1 ABC transporter type 1, transmembrane domain-containing protein [Kockovaella imperatae]
MESLVIQGKTASLSGQTSERCREFWDGVDFTPCFRDRQAFTWYLQNFPLVLTALAAVITSLYYISKWIKSRDRSRSRLSPSQLISPTADSDLAQLESEVIVSSVAVSLLPAPKGKKELPKPLSPEDALNVIRDFKRESRESRRWQAIRYWIRVIGGFVWVGLEVARYVQSREWRDLVFPTFTLVLALIPRSPLTYFLSAHIIPSLLLLRSAVIRSHTRPLDLAPPIFEAVYWCLMISIPYYEGLENVLEGGRSKGGGSLGSYGAKLPRHIEEPTSSFSRAAYMFMLPLLFKHYRHVIRLEDVPALREDDSSATALAAFRKDQAARDAKYAKKHNGAKRQRDLAWDLLRFFGVDTFIQCLWSCFFICLQYLPPVALRLLLKFFTERESRPWIPNHVAFLYVAMMAGEQCLGVVAYGQALYLGRRRCIRLRAILIAEVFAKALRRQDMSGSVKSSAKEGSEKDTTESTASATDGKIANLVSYDAFQTTEICAYLYYLVSCPLAIIINSILLYSTLGVAAFAGMGVLVLMIPIQAVVGKLFTVVQKRFMAAVDLRLEAVTEVIAHIKLIKFNAWETKFFDRMSTTRTKELYYLAQRFGVSCLSNVLVWGTPVLVTASAFAVHSLVLKQPLTADRAFASLVLFNMLRDPMGLFQETLLRLIQAYTSCQRIQEFLDEPETLKYQQLSEPGPDDPKVGFTNATFGYSESSNGQPAEHEPFKLGPLNLDFLQGTLSIIIGPVGSGKTTLITSLLGETRLLAGKVFMTNDHANRDICPVDPETGLSNTVAYCAQTPWLLGATIRDNIVFGSTWNSNRYQQVLDACALRRDLEIFDLGDETEVGEKGTTCSGGQKARIALARALYSPAKTILLDDVLSAVDAQTAQHIHVHCLQGPLMRGRTCLMVTHAVSLVAPTAGFVVMLEDGRVAHAGTPAKLEAAGVLEIISDDADHTSGSQTTSSSEQASDEEPTAGSSTLVSEDPIDIIEENLDGVEGDALETAKQVEADKAAPAVIKLDKQLVQAETSQSGVVGAATYGLYFKYQGKIIFWILLGSANIGSQMLQVSTNTWIKNWANSNDKKASMLSNLLVSKEPKSTEYYLGIYCAIAGAYLLTLVARMGIGYWGSLRASRKLYSKLLKRILGAKMRFFDSTPSGRIMNRLSKDVSSIDTEASEILQYFANCVLAVIAVLAVVVFSTPKFIFALIAISIMYWTVGVLYVTTNREIKRHDSVTRSPLFISFSEALVGMSTIRSYGDSPRFLRKLFNELDQNNRCFWYLWQANRVLNNFSNFVGSLVTLFACIFALQSTMDAGAVGLSITYALSFTDFVLWVVRLYAAAEMTMNSVERVAEYLQLDVEEEDHDRGRDPPAYWPTVDGSVEVKNLTCRYAPQLDPVLRNVSFTIQPKEKIGICGRTGSGKSTLALSFFRFLHQESGSIFIDGIDIGKLNLESLRSRLTILPQEAQLFSGTIRDNLDPFDQHEDAEVWDVLRQVGLSGRTPFTSRHGSRAGSSVDLKSHSAKVPKDDLRTKTLKSNHEDTTKTRVMAAEADSDEEVEERVVIRSLDEKVAVGGKNFSQGQRQLLAMARGLLKLRTSNFLIMDESTANLDHATDMTIQNVLRTSLADTQMLVIAHRLMTVCGLDKILVLDQGQVVEYGTPWELMQKEHGTFRDLCRQSGEEAQLIEVGHPGDGKEDVPDLC